MTEYDLNRFKDKVKQLSSMVSSLDEIEGRRESLVSCKTHEEVVELASLWGYEISRRWGDRP